jgi:hypothetical protein
LLRPTPEEVLNAISYTFDTLIRPDPVDPLARSYALTVSNMLRQLMLTMRHEEKAIAEDTVALRAALGTAAAFLASRGDGLAAGIDAALGAQDQGVEPARWARANWRALRGVLERTIVHLQALRAAHGAADDYRAARRQIRDYLDASLDREKILIDGAFTLARR